MKISNGVNFVFFGTSQFAILILETLKMGGVMPSLIITTPDKPAGRGLKTAPPPIKRWAEKHATVLFQPKKLDDDFFYKLQDTRYKIFIVAAYGKLIPKKILEIPEKGALNIHPSLLPCWRGADPIRSSILAGDTETGVTIMLMDEKMDHGPILKSKILNLKSKKYTYTELEKELAKLGGKLLIQTIPEWIEGKIKPKEQNHSQATYTKKITKEDGRISWNEDATLIERKIRAFNPWPGTFTFWNGKRIKILEGRTIETKLKASAAGVALRHDSAIAIPCKKGVLLVKKLQLEGKSPLSATEFLSGYPDFVGSNLT
ncbi:methionyl-tRNA formyltransferase [Patescibacteria group bacterium]|nr:methionyl-tRNA formyltransferase [Patescibacteria group bacterium]